ncbi:MAG: response regulator, partial [Longimicrobiales bacterium]
TVRLETGPDGSPTAIAVEDTGIGIAPERLEAIFEAFAQADQSTSRRFGGTGLGLAISRSICQLLGYDLEVASTVGEGSTFTIRLVDVAAPAGADTPPLGPPGDAPTESGGVHAPSADPDSDPAGVSPSDEAPGSPRVLVVDDEAGDRALLTHHLNGAGWQVMTASSGHEALDLAHRERPDVITLDLRMPDLDGRTVLRQLKEHPVTSQIPIVVVSVAADEERAHLGVADEVLSKPVDREALLRALATTAGIAVPGTPSSEG